MGTAPLVSAVVVTHNSRETVGECLSSLLRQAGSIAPGKLEVLVVDNASSDGTRDLVLSSFPQVALGGCRRNLGYSRALNLGVARARGRFLILANADLVFEEGFLEAALAFLRSSEEVGVVGPLVLTPEGKPYPSARPFPSLAVAVGHGLLGLLFPENPFTRRYRVSPNLSGPSEVGWVSGACMVVRREAIEDVGGLDEGFFMYGEDVDLCLRVRRAGWKVVFFPGARVVHLGGSSAARYPLRMGLEHGVSLARLVGKEYSRGWGRLMAPLLKAAALGWGVAAGMKSWIGARCSAST